MKLNSIGYLVVLPGLLAHEATHAVAAHLLRARDTTLITVQGRPAVRIEWQPSTPVWKKHIAHIAPTLLAPIAILFGAAGIGAAVQFISPWTTALAVAIVIAGNVLAFGYPSYEDRHPMEATHG